tara:strand:- start:261 stop:761 length:501 start_codon:yes stop_codon:yes gene_type:complete
MKKLKNNGFTLIELIIVILILGILSGFAITKYLNIVSQISKATEDEVISNITIGLENFAMNQLAINGRRSWPSNPFDALDTPPSGYDPNYIDGETDVVDRIWVYIEFVDELFNYNGQDYHGFIGYQRKDNSQWAWLYNKGIQTGDLAEVGSIIEYGWLDGSAVPYE